jgi:predicted DNA-binding transcriptional regulator YafY
MPDYDTKLFRLIRILNELDSAKAVHTTDLAKEFNVSVRTAQRDINLLDKAGFPIISLQKGQYSFVEGFSLKKISVSHDEASLMALFYELSESLGGRFPKVYSGILKKLFSPVTDTPYFIKMPEVIRKDYPCLEVIEAGIEQSKTTRIIYDKHKEEKSYIIWPLKIVNYEGFWYLLARLDENEQIRTFRLEKIKEAKLLDKTFSMPDNLKILLDNSVNVWISDNRDKEIILKADADIAGYFKQKKYFPCQQIIKTEKDGSIVISTKVGQYEEALHVMMTWLPYIKVIKPPGFKEILSKILKESLKNI